MVHEKVRGLQILELFTGLTLVICSNARASGTVDRCKTFVDFRFALANAVQIIALHVNRVETASLSRSGDVCVCSCAQNSGDPLRSGI